MSTGTALLEVAGERSRQDQLHGFPVLADGTDPRSAAWAVILAGARMSNDTGGATWATILLEEVAEALLEEDRALIRAELVQVAAVAVKWVEAIDRDSG